MNKLKTKLFRLFVVLAGKHSVTAFEQFIFNILLAFSALVLLFFSFSKLLFQHEVTGFFVFLMSLSTFWLYYLSRFKNQFQASIVLMGILSYLFFGINYFYNSGINGPTAFIFILNFYILQLLSPKKLKYVWLTFHMLIIPILYLIEYKNPSFILQRYSSESEFYIDYSLVFAASLLIIYLLIYMYIKATQKQVRMINSQNNTLKQGVVNLKKINNELEQMDKEKSKFFSIISHDIRSPLTTIQSYLEYSKLGFLSEHEEQNMQQKLVELTKTSSEMLNNLIVWSNNQMKGTIVKSEIVFPSIVIQDILKVQLPIANSKGISISTQVATNISIISDFSALSFIVRQVLNNAIKYSHSNSNITIQLNSTAKDFVVLSIQDSGIGMDNHQLNNLFNLTTNSKKGTSKEKGIGLGLYISYEYVQKLGGKIEVESELNKGTTFHIYLPKK